jgi:hypothetical protein
MAGGIGGATPCAATPFAASPLVGEGGSTSPFVRNAAFRAAAEASIPFKKPRMAFANMVKHNSCRAPTTAPTLLTTAPTLLSADLAVSFVAYAAETARTLDVDHLFTALAAADSKPHPRRSS